MGLSSSLFTISTSFLAESVMAPSFTTSAFVIISIANCKSVAQKRILFVERVSIKIFAKIGCVPF
jgi:hypothetical protein